jgi:error-prone DNA polymerase
MLFCKSNFSFLEGASHPEELISQAHTLNWPALALTDRDGIYGIVRAYKKAKELGLHFVVGSQVTLEDASSLILLAQNKTGYTHLCRLLSRGHLRSAKGHSMVSWSEICEHAPGLIALWGGSESLITQSAEPDFVAKQLREAFNDRLYALLTRHLLATDNSTERRLRERAKRYNMPVIAGTEVLYHSASRQPLQDVLTCIRQHVSIEQASTLLRPNSEHAMKSLSQLRALFADDPEALNRTFDILTSCTFSLSELRYRYPSEKLPNGNTSFEHLRTLVYQGAKRRYGHAPSHDTIVQIDKELGLIDELDYCGYFLTMREIVEYCEAHDILCQGRGSAANSVVCYCLGITAVDPVKLGFLFERFISRERAEPPDIDLDIQHNRREEVIQHVYQKYGRTHAAMVANVVRYRARSAIRDVGKVLGFSEEQLSEVTQRVGHYDLNIEIPHFKKSGIDSALLAQLATEILDFPRHLSIHPGGFLLGHEPVCDLVPIENGSMPERTVIQWDKNDLEDLGLFKVDLLSLGSLTLLDLAFKAIEKQRGKKLCMATLPVDDPATYAMMTRGDTLGVFQIESRAQMSMLPRLKPRSFYDLVIQISIVRPGPITGGMVHPYLRRRNGEETVDYPHPSLEPILRKTLGVPLFQEQVMRIAMTAADYTPGEADQLRRDMAAWKRSGRLEAHRERMLTRIQAKGISLDFADRLFNQIKGFGDYGFPESHAASFALIAYASAYIRCHFPVEFTYAVLNAQPMGFYAPSTLVHDAQRSGVVVLPIDINRSNWHCAIVHGQVQMGLRYVKGLSKKAGEEIMLAGPFDSLEDFVKRTTCDLKALKVLAQAGAFANLGIDRRAALWQVRSLIKQRQQSLELRRYETLPLFATMTLGETIAWDYETTSHSSEGHPLKPLRNDLNALGLPEARKVLNMRDGSRINFAGVVICRQQPQTAGGVVFITLEDETGFVNIVIWEKVYKKFRTLAKTTLFLGVTGRLQVQDNVTHLIAEKLWSPALLQKITASKSRDFH